MTSTPVEPARFLIRLPRPLWAFLATVVLLIAIVGLRIGVTVYRQHAAVREIERLGVQVAVHPIGPEWLREFVGIENLQLFGTVTGISVGGWRGPENEVLRVGYTDQHVRLFQDFRDLEYLFLDGSRITDDGLSYVTHLPKLHVLNLEGTDVSDVGLAHLQRLTTLKVLYVRDTHVTDEGAAELMRVLPDLHIER